MSIDEPRPPGSEPNRLTPAQIERHDFSRARKGLDENDVRVFLRRFADQFDAMIHIDNTRALEPLELTSDWIAGELHETYPTGL